MFHDFTLGKKIVLIANEINRKIKMLKKFTIIFFINFFSYNNEILDKKYQVNYPVIKTDLNK